MFAETYFNAAKVTANHNDRFQSEAGSLYNRTLESALIGRVWSGLSRRSNSLASLEDVKASIQVNGSHYAGMREVPVHMIHGSESRVDDFDAQFRPLRLQSRNRWSRIAAAQQKGETLPPIELIQVGDEYFVRDGHHRVSVAKALGQEVIEAEVTVLKVEK